MTPETVRTEPPTIEIVVNVPATAGGKDSPPAAGCVGPLPGRGCDDPPNMRRFIICEEVIRVWFDGNWIHFPDSFSMQYRYGAWSSTRLPLTFSSLSD